VALSNPDIIAMLRQDINRLNGFKSPRQAGESSRILQPLLSAFPQKQFPLSSVHEFICPDPSGRAATVGFISVILSAFFTQYPLVWISEKLRIFPPSLPAFTIEPSRIVFIHATVKKDILWAAGESMKCRGVPAVICELTDLDFEVSRKFQLAVEQSGVTALVIRNTEPINATASIARWRISHMPSLCIDGIPGLGFPTWNVRLLKLRNGNPSQWHLAYRDGKLVTPEPLQSDNPIVQRKTG
jgi:protein ImuA